ncbi:MAG TPA: HAD family hydrolase [Gammaproteobacteria bacterium]|nr:HAD family hydrolase [Gammaproteobacteria bacterium]
MKLALFDLDHTLLDGDSDSLWGQYLVREGVLDGERYARANARYYADYRAGRLDIHEFLAFGLKPLADNDPARLEAWRERFVADSILPRIPAEARALLGRHREAGHVLAIITATNSFVTAPVAAALGVPHLIATEPERDGGRFTGRISGVPCFREGKVTRLKEWLYEEAYTPEETWFYSDSHNDLPLLTAVQHPVAVNPDEVLLRTARERGWPVLHLKAAATAA